MDEKTRVGDLRPSQILFSFGVGSMVDLPYLSVMVMGLDDWDRKYMSKIQEERLLVAVRQKLGQQVEHLYYPPLIEEEGTGNANNPYSEAFRVGIPVAPFPRWMRCPQCNLLAPLNFGVFSLKTEPFRPDKTRYVHSNCEKARSTPPTVLPVRFLVACEGGHMDDFPWITFVHNSSPCAKPVLRLREWGVSGSVSEVEISCDTCNVKRRMRDAFAEDRPCLPPCSGRRPHLRDHADKACEHPLRTILLGASNSWFPICLSTLSVPSADGKLKQMIEDQWANLDAVTSPEILAAFRKTPLLRMFSEFSDEEIWAGVRQKREGPEKKPAELNLKVPEWQAFSNPNPNLSSSDFLLKTERVPHGLERYMEKIVLVERLREVRAVIGFSRLDSPGNFEGMDEGIPQDQWAPLARRSPQWVPATEIRGEGIFIQFREDTLDAWCRKATARDKTFADAHRIWRTARKIDNPKDGFPGIRYVLLHSFAHMLMRQIALECGYTAASIRERIYSQAPNAPGGAMAGVLIYTGAADSEGTLGGLVSLGRPENLGRHIVQALEQVRLCASDPLCAEHDPCRDGISLHGAACHACLFAPETSCEQGNKYLDRCVLVPTFGNGVEPFFGRVAAHE